jgi:hypothetical protein
LDEEKMKIIELLSVNLSEEKHRRLKNKKIRPKSAESASAGSTSASAIPSASTRPNKDSIVV